MDGQFNVCQSVHQTHFNEFKNEIQWKNLTMEFITPEEVLHS